MLYELKRIRKASGISQVEAAEEFGVPLGTYRNWEQNIYMPRENSMLLKIAHHFGVSVEELFGYDLVGPGTLAFVQESSDKDSVLVPLFGRVAAGPPLEMDDIEDHISLDKSLYRQYPESFFLRVDGESMNRVLPNGSFALIDQSKANGDVISGRVYAVCINGHSATIKVIKRLENGFVLVPDSSDPTFKPEVFDNDDPRADDERKLTIIGEVVWYTVPADFMSNYQYSPVNI